jgi:hypothetical protein
MPELALHRRPVLLTPENIHGDAVGLAGRATLRNVDAWGMAGPWEAAVGRILGDSPSCVPSIIAVESRRNQNADVGACPQRNLRVRVRFLPRCVRLAIARGKACSISLALGWRLALAAGGDFGNKEQLDNDVQTLAAWLISLGWRRLLFFGNRAAVFRAQRSAIGHLPGGETPSQRTAGKCGEEDPGQWEQVFPVDTPTLIADASLLSLMFPRLGRPQRHVTRRGHPANAWGTRQRQRVSCRIRGMWEEVSGHGAAAGMHGWFPCDGGRWCSAGTGLPLRGSRWRGQMA